MRRHLSRSRKVARSVISVTRFDLKIWYGPGRPWCRLPTEEFALGIRQSVLGTARGARAPVPTAEMTNTALGRFQQDDLLG